MLKDAERSRKQPERTFTAVFALLATALSCSIVVVLAPRPVQPSQLPALRLDPRDVEAALLHEHELVARAHAFERDPDVLHVLSLYRDEGLSELQDNVDLGALGDRRRELAASAENLFARLGVERTRALIASTTERAMMSLAGKRNSPEARGLLGSFPAKLTRYGYIDASRRGYGQAPALAVRTLYKARFNLITERPLERDLSAIELQAYEGFNALHATGLPAERRAQAAQTFLRAGGRDGAEAAAIWLWQGGAREQALALLRTAYRKSAALRLRNMALYVSSVE
jgi:hypothetical protein